MQTEEKIPIEVFDQRSWEYAAERVRSLGYMATSFTGCVRKLRSLPAESEDKSKALDAKAIFMLHRIVRAETVKAHLYFLALTCDEASFDHHPFVLEHHLVQQFNPHELASILGLVFLCHRIKSRCDKKEWLQFIKLLQQTVDIGTVLTRKVKGLYLSDGILIPGIRYLALALFMPVDLRKFQEYRRMIYKEDGGFNLKWETATFGCNHIQVAALLLQEMGYGVSYSDDFQRALLVDPTFHLPISINRMRVTALWTDAMSRQCTPPEVNDEDEFMASEQAMKEIGDTAQSIVEQGSPHSWLDKNKKSISRVNTPLLFPSEEEKAAYLEELKKSGDSSGYANLAYEDLPATFQAQFTAGEVELLRGEVASLLSEK